MPAAFTAALQDKRTAQAVLFFANKVTQIPVQSAWILGHFLFLGTFWRILNLALRPCWRGHCMKTTFLISWMTLACATSALAQDRIYRCGNEYTNTVTEAQAKNCKLVSGGNVTVVQSAKPAASAGVKVASSGGGAAAPRIDSSDQRAKDSDARLILEAELKKAEARQIELVKEYNNGEPEKLGPEARNHQKYLDRVAELKAAIARNESDIAGIRRELGRVPASNAPLASVK